MSGKVSKPSVKNNPKQQMRECPFCAQKSQNVAAMKEHIKVHVRKESTERRGKDETVRNVGTEGGSASKTPIIKSVINKDPVENMAENQKETFKHNIVSDLSLIHI